MAEQAAEKKTEKKEKKPAAPKGGGDATPAEMKRADAKTSRWTLEACMKAAKRFEHADQWKMGFPSSYKAAVARGWEKQCCAHMTAKAPAKKTATPAPKKKAPLKRSA